jgi:hypothetical protein
METPYVATFISNKLKYTFFFFLQQNWRTGGWDSFCVGKRKGLVLVGGGGSRERG